MDDLEQQRLKAKFSGAVDSFVGKVKSDPNVIAVIVGGSLAYDVVWEKSDIDMTLVIRDQNLKMDQYCILEDDILINAALMTRSAFRRVLEKSVGGSFAQSYFSKGIMVYTTDESLREFFEEMKEVGSDDVALSSFYAACALIGTYEKCIKWLNVRKDARYAQYYLLKAAEIIANMELCLRGEPNSRESIQRAMKLNPEAMKRFYIEPMTRVMTEEELAKSIGGIDDYLMEHLELLKKPVIDFMADGELKTITLIAKHFDSPAAFIVEIFEYLAEKGIIEKATQTIRITPKSKLSVEELGYLYLQG